MSQFTQEEKLYLLKLARQTLESYFNDGLKILVDSQIIPQVLIEERGTFVTLTQKANLRGCIGNITPLGPIYQSVIDNTLNAALDDPRFLPLTKEELAETDIEISILTLPTELEFNNSSELLEKLRPEIDGVIILQGDNQATYLPQVWKSLLDPEEFLGSLCRKAGLNKKCWQEPDTKIFVYQAEVFGE